jgi:hypoxanthine phosphoribosyltransferase
MEIKKPVISEVVDWQRFGDLCNELALKIWKEFKPDMVVGIVKAGVFPGAVIASLFQKDFYTIKLSRKHDEKIVHARPILFVPISHSVYGKKVLVVDEIVASGETIQMAKQEVEDKQAKEVKTCSMFVKPDGFKPDWYAYETGSKIICPWNVNVIENENLVPNPAYSG